MKKATLILLLLATIAYACTRPAAKTRLSRFQHLKGWQKIFGLLAVVLAVLILLNPELLALGLFGDAAFFDLLVLALSLQLQVHAVRFWHSFVAAFSKGLRLVKTHSPGLSYLLTISALAVTSAASAIQKTIHRIFS